MSNDRKWASNDKDKLLVENFKNFMKDGDFSADDGLDLLSEEETPHQKGYRYPSAKAMMDDSDPRVQFLGYLLQQRDKRLDQPKGQKDNAKEMYQKALELWFKGDVMSSKTQSSAERRLSREKGSFFGGKIQNFIKKSPLLMRMFRNREYNNMMRNFDNFMIYKDALEAVNYDKDKLSDEMKKLEKSFENDFVDSLVDDWRKEKAKKAARKRGEKMDPSTVDHDAPGYGVKVNNNVDIKPEDKFNASVGAFGKKGTTSPFR